MQVMVIAVQNAAPRQDIGAATGLVTLARTVGASVGLALNGATMVAGLANQQHALSPEAATALAPSTLATASPHQISALPGAMRDMVLAHYSAGFSWQFLVVVGLFSAATLVALALPNVQIPIHAKTAQPEERAEPRIGQPIAAHE